ncbi:hypothetical protein P692DRAFT_20837042 [Suillus brevipes Sb2]|nr:hypothetical protein P692DRAFT_20837042 [Suillus brevipes Sb2]
MPSPADRIRVPFQSNCGEEKPGCGEVLTTGAFLATTRMRYGASKNRTGIVRSSYPKDCTG